MPDDFGRALGQVEGQLKGIAATLVRVDQRSIARDEDIAKIHDDLSALMLDVASLKQHATRMVEVTNQFNALQQAIRDGKMQAKGFSIGVGFAAAAGGATVATAAAQIWKFFFGP